MNDDGPGGVFLADCPARLAVEVIADKWSVVVLAGLSEGPIRHGDLLRRIGGVSRKVLTQTLRRLQGHGLVHRQAYAQAPPRVEYSLTPLGVTLVDPIQALTQWAKEHGEEVVEALEAANQESVHDEGA